MVFPHSTSPYTNSLSRRHLSHGFLLETHVLGSLVCTAGLFEKHKLMFSFQMAIKILEGESLLNHSQLDFFLKGNLSLEKSKRRKPFDWFPDQGWEDVIRLAEISAHKEDGEEETGGAAKLKEIVNDIEKNESAWENYYNLEVFDTSAHLLLFISANQ